MSGSMEQFGVSMVVLFKDGVSEERRVEAASALANSAEHCRRIGDERLPAFLRLATEASGRDLLQPLGTIIGYRWPGAAEVREMACGAAAADLRAGLLRGVRKRLADEPALCARADVGALAAELAEARTTDERQAPEMVEVIAAWLGAELPPGAAELGERAEIRLEERDAAAAARCLAGLSAFCGAAERGAQPITTAMARGLALGCLACLDPGHAGEYLARREQSGEIEPFLLHTFHGNMPRSIGVEVARDADRQQHTPLSVLIELYRENRHVGFLHSQSYEAECRLPALIDDLRRHADLEVLVLPVPAERLDQFLGCVTRGDRAAIARCCGCDPRDLEDFDPLPALQQIIAIPGLTLVGIGAEPGVSRGSRIAHEQEVQALREAIAAGGGRHMLAVDFTAFGFGFALRRANLEADGPASLPAGLIAEAPELEARIWCAASSHESDWFVADANDDRTIGEICRDHGLSRSFALRIDPGCSLAGCAIHADYPNEPWAKHWDAGLFHFGGGGEDERREEGPQPGSSVRPELSASGSRR